GKAGNDHRAGDGGCPERDAAEHMAVAGKKPSQAGKPRGDRVGDGVNVKRSVDGSLADRTTKRDDGSPPRKPRALPVLVRHAPRASPRPWCLKNGELACR